MHTLDPSMFKTCIDNSGSKSKLNCKHIKDAVEDLTCRHDDVPSLMRYNYSQPIYIFVVDSDDDGDVANSPSELNLSKCSSSV